MTHKEHEALEANWVPGEKCRRKLGNTMLTYVVADTNADGALVKVVKGGRAVGAGKWHSWDYMKAEFFPSAKKLGKHAWFGKALRE